MVLSKLEWARRGESQRQVRDAASIVRARSDTLDNAYLDRWAAVLDVQGELAEARRTAAA